MARSHIRRTGQLQAARKYLAEYRAAQRADRTSPCCYGHLDCSTHEGGPCIDELLCHYPELADQD